MKIFDIFSWFTAEELSLKTIEEMFRNFIQGKQIDDEYMISNELPKDVPVNISDCWKELNKEGKKGACIMKGNDLIALIGYDCTNNDR